MTLPAVAWAPLLPVLTVTTTALVVLVVDLFLEGPDRDALAWLSILGLVVGARQSPETGEVEGGRLLVRQAEPQPLVVPLLARSPARIDIELLRQYQA